MRRSLKSPKNHQISKFKISRLFKIINVGTPEISLAALVMISSKSLCICNRVAVNKLQIVNHKLLYTLYMLSTLLDVMRAWCLQERSRSNARSQTVVGGSRDLTS